MVRGGNADSIFRACRRHLRASDGHKAPPVVVHHPPPAATASPLVARRSLQRLVHHRLPKDVAVLGLGDGVRGLPVFVDRAWVGTSLE